MLRLISVLPFVIGTLMVVAPQALANDSTPVLVSYAEPTLEPVARRLRAELTSAGHPEVLLENQASPGVCTAQASTFDDEGQVGILLRKGAEDSISAEICVRPQPNQLTVATAQGSTDEIGSFAVIVTEALHGLTLNPVLPAVSNADSPTRDAESRASTEPSADPPSLTWSVHAEPKFALDLPSGQAWLGVAPSVHFRAFRHFGVVYEAMVTAVPVSYQDSEIDLDSYLMWGRWGIYGGRAFNIAHLGWAGTMGLFSNHVRATAVAPRRGGSASAIGVTAHLGGFAELPARGRFFLRTSLGVGMLFPRLRYQMSTTITPELGAFLLEGGLGFGIRMNR